jgi:hypothetical protein
MAISPDRVDTISEMMADGTEHAPGLAFRSEPGLGIYRPAAGKLAIIAPEAAGTAKATAGIIIDDGNVGIGQATPTSKLHVVGTTNLTGNVAITGNIVQTGTNTWTGQQTIVSTDAGATVGPYLHLHRNSASPADNDLLGIIYFDGEDSGSTQTCYAAVVAKLLDITNTTEDGEFQIHTMQAGTLTEIARFNTEARIGTPATNYVAIDTDGELTLTGSAEVNTRSQYVFMDDFDMQQAWVEAETPWVLNEGTDGAAADPAISSAECGVALLTTGAGDGSATEDASQLVLHVPVQADSGNLVFETRLHINTAITNVSVFAGFTDNTAREEPFSNAADVITSTATDGCGFLYDTDATTDEWWMVAADGDADDAGNATLGTAPVADIYQTLRMEVSSDGATITFFINGTQAGQLTGDAGVSPDVNLYATIFACGDGTASKTVDVDYVYVRHTR